MNHVFRRAIGGAAVAIAVAVSMVVIPGAIAATDYDSAVNAATAVDPTLDPGPFEVGRTMAVGAGQSTYFGVGGPAIFAFAAKSDPLTGSVSGHMVLKLGQRATAADVDCMNAAGTADGSGTAVLSGHDSNGDGGGLTFYVTASGDPSQPDLWGYAPGVTDCTFVGYEFPTDFSHIFIRTATP